MQLCNLSFLRGEYWGVLNIAVLQKEGAGMIYCCFMKSIQIMC